MRMDKISVKDDLLGLNLFHKEFLNFDSVVAGQEPRINLVNKELKNDPYMVISFNNDIDVDGYDYKREVYGITQVLSAIGGLLASIQSGIFAVVGICSAHTIDINLVCFYYNEHNTITGSQGHGHDQLTKRLKYINSKKFQLLLFLATKVPGFKACFLRKNKKFLKHQKFLEAQKKFIGHTLSFKNTVIMQNEMNDMKHEKLEEKKYMVG